MKDIYRYLAGKSYPGRGILIGKIGNSAVIAYFIMGRSENSRNRVFVTDGDGIRTKAYDSSKLSDPSLIIYAPVRVFGDYTIVTNGDQTDTVYDYLKKGDSFENALRTREFEPDEPNYTPRISALVHLKNSGFDFKLSILKSDLGKKEQCLRYFYEYESPITSEGRIIHTYKKDGQPIPSFRGEPKCVLLPDSDIDTISSKMWEALDNDNKVSLFVRTIDLQSKKIDTRIINKNGGIK